MRTKIQAASGQLHGFLLLLGLTGLLAGSVFPEQVMFYFFHSFILLIPFLATYWAQHHVKHMISYLITGLTATACVVFLSMNFLELIYLTAIAIIVVFLRIPPRLADSDGLLDSPGMGFSGYFVLLFFAGLLMKKPLSQDIVYWVTFVYLINFLIYINLKSVNEYLYSRRDSANLPGQQILSTNRGLLMLFCAIAVAAMLILPLMPVDNMIYSIGIVIRDFIRWIFSHFSAEEEAIVETAAETVSAGMQDMGVAETSPTPAWLTMLYNILFGIVSFAAIAIFAAGVIYATVLLFRHFYRPVLPASDTQEFIGNDTDTDFIKDAEKKKRQGLFSQLTNPSAIIRRRFKKRIQKGVASSGKNKIQIPVPLTPYELECFAGLPDDEQTQRLHKLYEKARYSKEGCTREDTASLNRKN